MIAQRQSKDYTIDVFDTNIIKAILDSDWEAFTQALHADPKAVNHIHSSTGMSAIMLAASGQLVEYVAKLTAEPTLIDFEHRDNDDLDLISVVMRCKNEQIMDAVLSAYNHLGSPSSASDPAAPER